MIYPPVQALRRWPGSSPSTRATCVLTGTPGRHRAHRSAEPVAFLVSLLPPALKWKMFFDRQRKNPQYLQDGDVVEATIATDDGAIDLGTQRTTCGETR